MLIVIRIGSCLPIPGVDSDVFANWFASQTADGMGFFDAITGGSFYRMSIFALNITPYITSSIIMQLLTIAIPKLEEMQRDGEEGRKKDRRDHQISDGCFSTHRGGCNDNRLQKRRLSGIQQWIPGCS